MLYYVILIRPSHSTLSGYVEEAGYIMLYLSDPVTKKHDTLSVAMLISSLLKSATFFNIPQLQTSINRVLIDIFEQTFRICLAPLGIGEHPCQVSPIFEQVGFFETFRPYRLFKSILALPTP